MKPKFAFAVNVLTNERTGEIMAVYFRIRNGKAAEVRELCDGSAFANYNAKGELIGVELLAPCKPSVLMRLAADPNVKRFIKGGIPRQMELAAT
jgi:hypothetical protein